MGRPLTGRWSQLRTIPYANAAKWGTGINPVHEEYGGGPLRTYGRQGNVPDITPPHAAASDYIETRAPWGYHTDDIAGLDVFADEHAAIRGQSWAQDDWPSWNESTVLTRSVVARDSFHPWGSRRSYLTFLRSVVGGPRDGGFRESNQEPTETVTEGWRNKPTGEPADAEPADDKQVFIQTSMTQRYATRVNTAAVTRQTDDPRTEIKSRVAGQKLKIYSGEQRHYDMFPFQQREIIRPFWYRTAGTGNPSDMQPNEMRVTTPLQRTPPPDPTVGMPDINMSGDYGYTEEDSGYY